MLGEVGSNVATGVWGIVVWCELVLVSVRQVVKSESDGGDWLGEVVGLYDGSYLRLRQARVDWLGCSVSIIWHLCMMCCLGSACRCRNGTFMLVYALNRSSCRSIVIALCLEFRLPLTIFACTGIRGMGS